MSEPRPKIVRGQGRDEWRSFGKNPVNPMERRILELQQRPRLSLTEQRELAKLLKSRFR